MTKLYTTKSNATRAAKAAVKKQNAGGFELDRDCDGMWSFELTSKVEVPLNEMDQYGAGTEAAPACPHCGINHMDNGYSFHGADTPHDTNQFGCLACDGEWGPELSDFRTMYEGFKAAGNSMCRSLRLTAHEYNGNRKGFMVDAVANGVKPATASANWAAMKRGEF